MADCGLPRPLLEAWLDGECSVEERNRVEAHLPSCGVCRDAVDRAALGVGLFILNDAPPGKAGLRPSEGFTARVMARIAADPARSEGVDDDAPPAEGQARGVDDDAPPAEGQARGVDDDAPPAQGQARGVDDDAPPAQGQARGVDDDAPPPPPKTWEASSGTSSRGTRSRGVDDDAPAASPPAAPPKGRLLRLPRPAWAGIAAAAAAAAAWVWLASDPGTTVPGPGPGPVVDVSRGSVAARDGGILRWSGAFDGALAGSVWVAKDAAVPTSAGELLHSPVPSSFSARMPEGGRLEAGPSTWLAVGRPGEAALSDGAVTAYAGSGRSLTIETPAGLVTVPAGGEAEISSRAPEGGGSRDGGSSWLGSWAAARRDGVDPGRPLPPPPPAVQVVFARKGPVEVASGGPVRNSLERKFTLREGQALVVLEKKTFLAEGVDDDGPPDSSRWMDGMPVPPGSRFFRRPAGETAGGPPKGFEASGPVRNSLERTLGSPRSEPEERAYALSVYESVGGAEAVAAAAGAVDDPAVEVRCAALRVLALNASADRAAALPALRRLAQDGDAFVARFAILALKTLRDVEAIPVLKAIAIDDDAPPEGIVAKVYALDALVALGDNSLLREGAALLPEAEKDPVLGRVLQQFVTDALLTLKKDEIRIWFDDPRPGVKASALLALMDFELAESALGSDYETVRLSAALVLLSARHPSALDQIAALDWPSVRSRELLVISIDALLSANPATPTPEWVLALASRALSDPQSTGSAIASSISILDRFGGHAALQKALSEGSPMVRLAALSSSRLGLPLSVLRASLKSDQSDIRLASLSSLAIWVNTQATPDEATEAADFIRDLEVRTLSEARYKASVLFRSQVVNPTQEAIDAALRLAHSENPLEREAAASLLSISSDSHRAASLLIQMMTETRRPIAERAALSVLLTSTTPSWRGPAPAELFPSPSMFPLVRIYMAIAAAKTGVIGALDELQNELKSASSRTRRAALTAMTRVGLRLPSLAPGTSTDPDPAVRALSVAVLGDSSDLSAVLPLRDDVNLWVRAIALATIKKSGDLDATAPLVETLKALSNQPGFAAHLAGTAATSESEIALVTIMATRQAIDEGTIGSALDESELAQSRELVAFGRSGLAAHVWMELQAQTDVRLRTELVRSLSRCEAKAALAILAVFLGGDTAPTSDVASASRNSYSTLIGFTATGLDLNFHLKRGRAYLTENDILLAGP